MDTRTSPARLRIERDPGAAARSGLRRRRGAVERSAPLRVPARALAGAPVGLGLHRLDGHAGRHRRAGRAVRRQPLLGAGRAPSSPAAASSWSAHPDAGAARSTSTGCAPNVRARRDGRRRRRACSAWPPRASCATRSRAAASRCAATSTSSPPPGPSAPRCRRPRGLRARRRRTRRTPRAGKLAQVRAAMAAAGATHHFVSTVDDIAWLTQPARRRRRLQPGLPRPPADRRRRGDAVRRRRQGRRRAARARWPPTASRWPPTTTPARRSPRCRPRRVLLVDPRRITLGLRRAAPRRARHRGDQPEHARQEPQERRRGRQRARGDDRGRHRDVRVLRLVRRRSWPTRRARAPITELTIDEKLSGERARAARATSARASPTIAAFNANGAMPHYRATPESHADDRGRRPAADRLRRAVPAAARPTSRACGRSAASATAQRRDSRACCTARWRSAGRAFRAARCRRCSTRSRARRSGPHGLDYGHGTGHGVGYFLNVHEGPQSDLARRSPSRRMAMQPGMITSDRAGRVPARPAGACGSRTWSLNVPAHRSPTSSASSSSSRR